jgi:Glycosyl-4,4'-diaponeurosporenoate acyltransferase
MLWQDKHGISFVVIGTFSAYPVAVFSSTKWIKSNTMEILKKLTLFIVSSSAAIFFIAWTLGSFGFHNPISALVVNWFVLAWLATITLVTPLALPATYYVTRPFERTGQCYERLGIRRVRKFLRRGPLSILSPTLRLPKERTVSALRNVENQMRKAETAHMLTFSIMLLLAGYATVNGCLDAVLWLLFFDILINVYPIMLQRYNRTKVQELIRKLEREG